MPTHTSMTASSILNPGVLLSLARVDGVDPQDPAGTLPPDAKQVGIVCVIDRWPNFPVSGVRVEIPFDDLFNLKDIVRVQWQAWDSLNGSGKPLMQVFEFNEVVTDVVNRQSVKRVIKPFASHIEPMRENHSAIVNYQLLRNGVPIFPSFTGRVKVDRVIPGRSEYCVDSSWMT